MPAQSKSQQRFFGVVKAMQKGDIPKKGRAGKIAKTMDKDDVDDFASTKHKGKPEKVKREQRVRELIKKMVREEMNEVRIPFSSSHIKQLKRAFKDMKGTLPDNNPLVQQIVTLLKKTDKKVLKQIASADIKYLSDKAKDILGEEKITESKKRRYTVKEVRMWMKKLEENRYKKVYNSDARRVAWMVNNEGRTLDEMPISMKKKWTKAQYGRERYLATEFLKSKSEQLSEGLDIRKLENAIMLYKKAIKKQGRVTNARDEEHLKQLIKVYKQMGGRKIKEACQKGYKTHPTRKTKEMFGKRYRNCIKAEDKLKEGSDTFVNILNKFGFKKGARDWGGHQFFVHKSKDLYATYNPSGRSIVIEPKRGGKPVFDSARSNFSIRALLNYLQSPKNKFVSTEGKLTESQQVAKTILQQLGGNRFIAMTGAKNFGSSRNSLQFKIGRNSKSISHVIITLKSSDLYDVEFIRMRGTSRKVVKKVKGVYADQLGTMFKKYTGMNVRL